MFKVLSPEQGSGFTKSDMVEFLSYVEKCCNLNSPVLTDSDMNKLFKEASISEVKNNKTCLVKFMDGTLHKQLVKQEEIMQKNKKL